MWPETGAERETSLTGGLRFRIAAFLALALLPIGALGIVQTRDLAHEVESRSALTLLALTGSAAFGERQVFERAFGAAEGLSAVLDLLRDDPEACRTYLRDYIQSTERYSFVGFIDLNGIMECSSAAGIVDMSGHERLAARIAAPGQWIERLDTPLISREPIISILHPVQRAGSFAGYIAISIPMTQVVEHPDADAARRPVSLTTFNSAGDILTHDSTDSSVDVQATLPADRALAALAGSQDETFTATDRAGRERSFALVPIIPDLTYALGSWPPDLRQTSFWGMAVAPAVFPLLMFLASLAVAYFAMDRLVVQQVADLRRRMRGFARTREFDPDARAFGMSDELRDLDETFTDMALDLMDDEAKMEDALREKNVLLKEVHHRVKNNLQLISSIMNMQIRKAQSPETEVVLRRLQERIMGLSTVHQNLYQTENLSRTQADTLLAELFDQLAVTGIKPGSNVDVSRTFAPLILVPDQAVPLSLLASEAVTNALKYIGAVEGARPYLRAALTRPGPDQAEFTCENSLAAAVPDEAEGTGLGAQLVRVFAAQLGGEAVVETGGDFYRITVRFAVDETEPSPADH
ncbi:sensor histidine kinase [Roseovarius sp. LXJ103]|uniref:sensor histidine kinase n=1 Tax=Roseovarius carneus TaxID=2853164 RepID=UPI000D622D52|nr:histidine kinase dimerization/phosphoacceptor domain -containing protein [Roseovarius carneus]MBZ8118306.1 sensor histidine kinase [Roseovarius carneus]PWE35973.1 ATPase [Pelagicola sp. LXJ1103]